MESHLETYKNLYKEASALLHSGSVLSKSAAQGGVVKLVKSTYGKAKGVVDDVLTGSGPKGDKAARGGSSLSDNAMSASLKQDAEVAEYAKTLADKESTKNKLKGAAAGVVLGGLGTAYGVGKLGDKKVAESRNKGRMEGAAVGAAATLAAPSVLRGISNTQGLTPNSNTNNYSGYEYI